jgi:putative membrane-bound dehydrogenase-like protein
MDFWVLIGVIGVVGHKRLERLAVLAFHGGMRGGLGFISAAVLFGAAGAEPEVTSEQMPRVPATEPGRAAATFVLRPGFRAELLAAEPLVESPVAVAVDEAGAAYVVEMRDYSERRPERLGRIRKLEDTDGDGRYDKATVFLDGLPWPTAVMCWNGGVFIGATPDILYAKDTNGDGIADVREVVFTGFASGYAPYATNKLNVQALMNSFQWGPDHRIHGSASFSAGEVSLVDSEFTRRWRSEGEWRLRALGAPIPAAPTGAMALRGHDFSFDPRTLALRAEPGGGQHGMSFDSEGRKFVCSNSDHLQQIAYMDAETGRNPFHEPPQRRFSIAADGPAAEVYRRSPDEPWRVLRTRWRVAGLVEGPVEGGGRPSGYFTGATGATIYRGDAYGPDYAGDAFIADCGSNLVHRKKLRAGADGIVLVGERAPDEAKSEFLASTDNWFRPVQFYNGPDGCLWVIDMYRETIEHPWSLPPHLKSRLDLDSGRNRGRLWRLAPAAAGPVTLRAGLGSRSTAELASMLDHADGWHADTASRLLLERGDAACASEVEKVLRGGRPASRRRALALLAAVGGLTRERLDAELGDGSPVVRAEAVRLAAGLAPRPAGLERFAGDPDANVRLAWALAVAPKPGPGTEASVLARAFRMGPPMVAEAVVHAAAGREGPLWTELTTAAAPGGAGLEDLARTLGRQGNATNVARVLESLGTLGDAGAVKAAARGLAEGLLMEGRRGLVEKLPTPLPAAFAAAWELALHPPAPPKGPSLPPPNPDRLAVIASYLPALDLAGDGDRGAKTFEERCSRCHALRGRGVAVGPDLASAAANGPARLLVSIVDPNREVAPNFISWTAEPVDGEPVSGLLVRESDTSVTLRQPGGVDRTFSRSALKSFKADDRSLMPEGLEAGLSAQAMADLLALIVGR